MPIPTAYIRVERGTLVFPWGKNRHTIEVHALSPAEESVEVKGFSGPRMDGYDNNATGRPANKVSLIGSYTASDTTAMIARTGMRGSAAIQLGTGELWEGTCILVSSKFIGEWNGNTAKVEIVIQFNGKVTRTPIAAGSNP